VHNVTTRQPCGAVLGQCDFAPLLNVHLLVNSVFTNIKQCNKIQVKSSVTKNAHTLSMRPQIIYAAPRAVPIFSRLGATVPSENALTTMQKNTW